jgi:hypothetical protein
VIKKQETIPAAVIAQAAEPVEVAAPVEDAGQFPTRKTATSEVEYNSKITTPAK